MIVSPENFGFPNITSTLVITPDFPLAKAGISFFYRCCVTRQALPAEVMVKSFLSWLRGQMFKSVIEGYQEVWVSPYTPEKKTNNIFINKP